MWFISMKINNYIKNSFIDYPGQICTSIFVSGCNMNCWYCHNRELLDSLGLVDKTEEVLSFLETRKGKIDAVAISGGEPTLQKGLKEFIIKVKQMGFKIKLDTNGLRPEVLEDLLNNNLLDYVAMDIKAPYKKYEEITGVIINFENLNKSINLLKNSKINYEFRTTFTPDLNLEDVKEIGEIVKGAKNFSLQNYRPVNNLKIIKMPHKPSVVEEAYKIIKQYVPNAKLKGM